MNQPTEEVLEFLSLPGLDFGTTPLDLEMMQDPNLMCDLTTRLLAGSLPSEESRTAAETLAGRLGEVDWPVVSQAMQTRVRMTDALFDTSDEASRP